MNSSDILMLILSAGLSSLNGLMLYQRRVDNQRIRYLEENSMSKNDIRQLVEDKIGGIHSDLRDIKLKIDNLFNLYIDQIKK